MLTLSFMVQAGSSDPIPEDNPARSAGVAQQ
jgi:hypothetical protein